MLTMAKEKKTNGLFEGVTNDELTKEFINYLVDKKVKQASNEIWGIIRLYLCEKGMPYIDLIDFMKDKTRDFMKDKTRVKKSIEKLMEVTQGEAKDMESLNSILKDINDNDEKDNNRDNGKDNENE